MMHAWPVVSFCHSKSGCVLCDKTAFYILNCTLDSNHIYTHLTAEIYE